MKCTAVTFQWQDRPTGKWGFFDKNTSFVNEKWSPPLTRTAASQVLAALNGKLRLELSGAPFFDPLGASWWQQNALANSSYEDHHVTNPALVGPMKRVRAAAASEPPVVIRDLLTQIAKMPDPVKLPLPPLLPRPPPPAPRPAHWAPVNRGKGTGRGGGGRGSRGGSESGRSGSGSGRGLGGTSAEHARSFPGRVDLGGAPKSKRPKAPL